MISCLENDMLLETDNEVLVHCSLLTKTQMYYRCPYCWRLGRNIKSSPYKKNGDLYKTIKPTLHFHGNPNYKMGAYHKISHCTINKKSVRVVIDENTKRE